jgi:exodeoxyribonuclease VII large subunit
MKRRPEGLEGQGDLFGGGGALPPEPPPPMDPYEGLTGTAAAPAKAVPTAERAGESQTRVAAERAGESQTRVAAERAGELQTRSADGPAEPSPTRSASERAVESFPSPGAGAEGVFARTPTGRSPAPAALRNELAPERPARPERVVLTVGELTRQIKSTLERNFVRVCVRGEVSGFRGANARGHLYFAVKDAEACIDAKIWASMAQRLKFKLKEGMAVVVEGSIDLYEPQGRYSLIISRIEPEGQGALAVAFQQLKERLAAEGLIGENRKRAPRPIPLLPRRIGVVTSITGAALRDFLRVLHHRHPRLSVLVADSRVQGEGAADEVCRAIGRLSRTDVDVIVVTRGGGSVEDLWTFNEERVARAIHACPVPVVSAIGHEVDFTIADFASDLRMPTPSAAAERLAPVLSELELHLRTCSVRLRKAVERRVLVGRQRLARASARLTDPRRLLGQKQMHLATQVDRLVFAMRAQLKARTATQKQWVERLSRQHPQVRMQRNRAQLRKLSDRLSSAIRERFRQRQALLAKSRIALERSTPRARVQAEHRQLTRSLGRLIQAQRAASTRSRTRFQQLEARLSALSPLEVLSRGYSVTFRRDDGHVVRSVEDVKPGDALAIRLAPRGAQSLDECEEIDATVTSTKRQ